MLHLLNKEELLGFTATREGEVKLGEQMEAIEYLSELDSTRAQYVLFGIEEDIGIRANLGKAGAADCWNKAIAAICNIQSNSFLKGNEVIALGSLQFPELMKQAESASLEELRQLTEQIDQEVSELMGTIIKAGKTPIVIGGGHNNSFGNLKGSSIALGQAVSALNIDPHTDYRDLEGRHSGNGFSYASDKGYLAKYLVYGLHEGYNGNDIIMTFDQDLDLHYQRFEELLHLTEAEKKQNYLHSLNWLGDGPMALELDLDSITHFPVSALNPSGFSLNEVRKLVRTTSTNKAPVYFHICEGSPGRSSSKQEIEILSKSMAYLVTDFIKAQN